MDWTVILALAGLGVMLLIIGFCIAKRALKMKAQGKEDFKLYAIGCTITMPGILLLICCGLQIVFNAIF